jgi:LuxR family quorum sensing-dependent transcriptional regulator
VGAASSSVLDFVDAIEKIKGADEVWNRFLRYSSAFGMHYAALVDVPGPGERLIDTALYMSCPPEWRRRYFENNYFPNDPAVLHLARTIDPFTWTEALACPDYTTAQRKVVHEAGEFDMLGGFVVPLVGLRTRTAVIELAGPNESFCTRERAELQMASMAVNSRLRAIFKPRRHKLPPLSNREREVLQWAAVGKSDWEIGEILSISEKTVNAHIENVKRKYGVTSRIHAVVKGMNAHAIHL